MEERVKFSVNLELQTGHSLGQIIARVLVLSSWEKKREELL